MLPKLLRSYPLNNRRKPDETLPQSPSDTKDADDGAETTFDGAGVSIVSKLSPSASTASFPYIVSPLGPDNKENEPSSTTLGSAPDYRIERLLEMAADLSTDPSPTTTQKTLQEVCVIFARWIFESGNERTRKNKKTTTTVSSIAASILTCVNVAAREAMEGQFVASFGFGVQEGLRHHEEVEEWGYT